MGLDAAAASPWKAEGGRGGGAARPAVVLVARACLPGPPPVCRRGGWLCRPAAVGSCGQALTGGCPFHPTPLPPDPPIPRPLPPATVQVRNAAVASHVGPSTCPLVHPRPCRDSPSPTHAQARAPTMHMCHPAHTAACGSVMAGCAFLDWGCAACLLVARRRQPVPCIAPSPPPPQIHTHTLISLLAPPGLCLDLPAGQPGSGAKGSPACPHHRGH
jgi:hypothetical protein